MDINTSAAVAAMGSSAGRAGSASFKVDVSRGERVGRVSSEWFSRPDDERFLSLPELYEAVRARADRASARTVESRTIRVEARRDDGERLALIVPGQERPVAPTHWSFGQLCGLVGNPPVFNGGCGSKPRLQGLRGGAHPAPAARLPTFNFT